MTTTDPFLADCSVCTGLCCMALAFDKGDRFAIDKPAGQACPHLDPRDRCRIHGELAGRGFGGCAGYDCLGAGQIVSRDLFPGRHWRDDPATRQAMIAAFATLREIQEIAAQVRAAEGLPLDKAARGLAARLFARLDPGRGWSMTRLQALGMGEIRREFRALLELMRQGLAPGGRPAKVAPKVDLGQAEAG